MEEQSIRSLESLPLEMNTEILQYLSFKQAYMSLGVCRLWYTILWEMLPKKLGPGSSYETLKECAELIIKHNRKVRSRLMGKAYQAHRKKRNKLLYGIIQKNYEDLQQKKFDVIQCLLNGAYLNSKNNINQYYSDSILMKNHGKPTDFLFFLLSLGNVLPKNTGNNILLETCRAIAYFNESASDKGEELTNLLKQLNGKVIPNFYASEERSAFKEVYDATGGLFLLSYANIFLAAGTASDLLWKGENTPLNKHYFNDNDIDHFEKLIDLHTQLGTDLMCLFRNTLESNPNHKILEKLYTHLNISDDMLKELYSLYAVQIFQMKYLPDDHQKKKVPQAYKFLCGKLSSMHIN
jgi:hypothetical protein